MKTIFLICFSLLLISATVSEKKQRVIVIGDSTASDYDASRFPRTGWAQVLQTFLKVDNVAVINKARSGRSSKSFLEESGSYWPSAKAALQPGDYLIIQFGHNDEKSDAARSTLPGSTYEEYLSVYIDAAIEKGAYPILATPIERNGWDSDTKMKASHGKYPQAMRDLAKAKKIPLIDLTALTTARFEELGKEATTTTIFMNLEKGAFPNYKDGNSDNTHLQITGAKVVAQLFIDEVTKQNIQPLASWVIGAAGTRHSAIAGNHGLNATDFTIVNNGSKTVGLLFSQPVISFSIVDIMGRVVHRANLFNDNRIYLSGTGGTVVKPGKYSIEYRFANGSKHHKSFCIQ